MRDPTIDEPHFTREFRPNVALIAAMSKEAFDFETQRIRDFFVGIETECPGLGGEIEGFVFRITKAFPFAVVDNCSVFFSDGFARVTRIVEHDYNF